MDKRTTFGVSLRQSLAIGAHGLFDPQKYREFARRAESLGYDYFVAADHVFVPAYMSKRISDYFLDPFTLLSFAAAHTSRIELVVGCLVVPYRQPITTANAVASLDQLSAGRFALGVVPGYLQEEFEAFGLRLEERNAMTNEFVRIMIALWTKEVASFHGEYYSFDDIDLKPKCVRSPRVPIWVGGSSRRAMRRVAEFGDVWYPLGSKPSDEAYVVAKHEELAGKSLPTRGTTPNGLREGLDFIERVAADASRDVSELSVVVHSGQLALGGQEAIDWFGRNLDAGATGFVVSPPGDTLDECKDNLTRIAEEVIPAVSSSVLGG